MPRKPRKDKLKNSKVISLELNAADLLASGIDPATLEGFEFVMHGPDGTERKIKNVTFTKPDPQLN